MTDTIPISEERLSELIAGCEGVTPGPWTYEVHELGSAIAKDNRCIITAHGSLAILKTELPHSNNAVHVAACDPDTIRSLATELQSLRAFKRSVDEAVSGQHDDLPPYDPTSPRSVAEHTYAQCEQCVRSLQPLEDRSRSALLSIIGHFKRLELAALATPSTIPTEGTHHD